MEGIGLGKKDLDEGVGWGWGAGCNFNRMLRVWLPERVTFEQDWNKFSELALWHLRKEFQVKRIASEKYLSRHVLEMAMRGVRMEPSETRNESQLTGGLGGHRQT